MFSGSLSANVKHCVSRNAAIFFRNAAIPFPRLDRGLDFTRFQGEIVLPNKIRLLCLPNNRTVGVNI